MQDKINEVRNLLNGLHETFANLDENIKQLHQTIRNQDKRIEEIEAQLYGQRKINIIISILIWIVLTTGLKLITILL